MIQFVYQALKKRILTELPDVAQVDWYYSQYEESEDGNLVWTTPSIYIEFAPVDWQQFGTQFQRATVDVTLHIVSASAYGAEDFRQTEQTDGLTITHLGLVSALYKKLQGFGCKYNYLNEFPTEATSLISGMVRKTTEVSHQLSVFNVTKVMFELNTIDCDAVPMLTQLTTPIVVVVNPSIVIQ
jgi:hypothetical protein